MKLNLDGCAPANALAGAASETASLDESRPARAPVSVPASRAPDLWRTAAAVLAAHDQVPPLVRFPAEGAVPLSFAQERLWWLEQLEPEAAYYNVPLSWEILGDLNVPALEQSLNCLVQRHEALRTSFPATGTEVSQRVDAWQLQLPVEQVKGLDGPSRWEATLAQARAFVRRPFDLAAGPLFRSVLYRVEPRRHLLVLLMHQMVFDGASMRLLGRELSECYQAFAQGGTPHLPALPIRYSDFARWQRQHLAGERLGAALEFWRGQCRSSYSPLPLPLDHPRRESAPTPGAQAEVLLPKALAQRLKRLGRAEGVTPFVSLLASFQAFLAHETGQSDVLSLVTVAGRNQPELRHLVGLVANVLPLRFDCSGNPAFQQVLHGVGQVVAAALAHQTLPLDRILELLPAGADGANATALQVLVLYYHQPVAGFQAAGAVFTPFAGLYNEMAKGELTLDVADSPEGISGYLKYRSDLFERSTIERLIVDWKRFTEEAIEHPTRSLLVFPPASPASAQAVPGNRPAGFAPALSPTEAEPPRTAHHAPRDFVPPRNEIEAKLVGIWETLFAKRPIGIHDRFFELGGHSLLAVRLNFRIRETLGVELPMHGLLEAQTIAALAEGLAAGKWQPVSAGEEPLPAVRREGPLPLSFAQQRLWFIDQLEPNSPLYNVPVMARLSGTLDCSVLERTLNTIVARHEVLRTRFVPGPLQAIEPALSVPVRQIDLAGLPAAEREAEAWRLAREEANCPFNLSTGPLLRVLLLRLQPEEHLLVLNLHHIVSDEWSLGVLFREFAALYSGLVRQEQPALAELPVQYVDYAVWQRQWLEGAEFHQHLEYWKGQLQDPPPLTELPTDQARGARPTFRGACQTRRLPAELSQALTQFAQREGVTLFMVLLAAFKTLLHRYTRQEDLIVSSPIAGRSRAETEDLIGFFVNTLLLRTDLSGDPSFAELLQRVRTVTLEGCAHQEAPFDKIVEALQPERSLRHLPFTGLMFVLQNHVLERLHLPALEVQFEDLTSDTSKFDATLVVQETSRGLVTRVEYNTDLFEAATMVRLLEHWEVLLQGIIANPTQRLSQLPLMGEPEKQQVLVEWNRTQSEFPHEKTLVDLFTEQVARTPEAEALVSGAVRLSYRELAARSQEVARRLQALGVGPETPVGICLERSWPMVAALLGTLQAGGTYVPLDPTYPPERLSFMLEDAGVKVVITQEKLLGTLNPKAEGRELKESRSAKPEVASLCLDQIPWDSEEAHASRITHHGPRTTDHGPRSTHLAYIIYTSGSTGQPKGVALEHRSAVALMHWARENYRPEELAGVLAATSLCFDLSVFELFVPLSWGGKVIVAENALALAELPAAPEVSLINTVPSAMRELLRLKAVPASVRVVNLAGEPLAAALVDQIYRETQVAKVYDLYGPTETTTYSTGGLREPGASASIGRPLANEQVYVLDPQREPVPIGVAGEIYLGGAGLARGYLNRPQLTAERFVAHPFQEGARLYRTGDLGRWRADGRLEYLGRLDHQVKVRGFRIELGEIEAALRSQPSVEQAIVVARENAAGDKQLVAYVVGRAGESLDEAELRAKLEARLPAYMVPAHVVSLAALPLTANGKVDRKQLAAIELRPAAAASVTVAPRNPTETMLADIWHEVLGIESVGIHDNFFRLGGHSLLAVRLFARIEAVLGQKLPLVTVFQAPTIEQMARVLGDSHTDSAQSLLVPIQPNGTRPPLFLVHGAGGDVLWGYANLSSHLSPDQPVYGIKSRGQAGLPELTRVEEMARCYLEAVRAFQPQGPYYLGGYCFGGNLACEMARQLLAQGQQVALVVLLDSAPANIGYEVAPWWRPSYLVRFVRNLGIWLADFAALSGHDRRTFVARKLRAFGRHLKRRLRREPGPEPVDLEGFIDLSHFSQTELKLWRIHLEAASHYIQPTYLGSVTLLRTRGQPLLCSLDEDFCWSRVAQGGVVVQRIPGSHESIFTEPNVQHLAQHLETCLAQARAQTAPAQGAITSALS